MRGGAKRIRTSNQFIMNPTPADRFLDRQHPPPPVPALPATYAPAPTDPRPSRSDVELGRNAPSTGSFPKASSRVRYRVWLAPPRTYRLRPRLGCAAVRIAATKLEFPAKN